MNLPKNTAAIGTHLTVRDIPQAMDFYDKVLGFRRKLMLPGPGGRIMHAEMVYAGCTLMLGPESPQRGMKSPASLGGTPVSMFVYVEDVDSAFERAQQHGATVLVPVNDQFFGCRTFVMLDPDGHQWMVATQKQEMSADEILAAMNKEKQHI